MQCPSCNERFVVQRDPPITVELTDGDTMTASPPREMDRLDFRTVGLTWRVRAAADGSVRHFHDLQGLKSALVQGRVGDHDHLSHNGRDWMELGAIRKLETHFWDIWQRAKRGHFAGTVTRRVDPGSQWQSEGEADPNEEDTSDAPTRIGTDGPPLHPPTEDTVPSTAVDPDLDWMEASTILPVLEDTKPLPDAVAPEVIIDGMRSFDLLGDPPTPDFESDDDQTTDEGRRIRRSDQGEARPEVKEAEALVHQMLSKPKLRRSRGVFDAADPDSVDEELGDPPGVFSYGPGVVISNDGADEGVHDRDTAELHTPLGPQNMGLTDPKVESIEDRLAAARRAYAPSVVQSPTLPLPPPVRQAPAPPSRPPLAAMAPVPSRSISGAPPLVQEPAAIRARETPPKELSPAVIVQAEVVMPERTRRESVPLVFLAFLAGSGLLIGMLAAALLMLYSMPLEPGPERYGPAAAAVPAPAAPVSAGAVALPGSSTEPVAQPTSRPAPVKPAPRPRPAPAPPAAPVRVEAPESRTAQPAPQSAPAEIGVRPSPPPPGVGSDTEGEPASEPLDLLPMDEPDAPSESSPPSESGDGEREEGEAPEPGLPDPEPEDRTPSTQPEESEEPEPEPEGEPDSEIGQVDPL